MFKQLGAGSLGMCAVTFHEGRLRKIKAFEVSPISFFSGVGDTKAPRQTGISLPPKISINWQTNGQLKEKVDLKE